MRKTKGFILHQKALLLRTLLILLPLTLLFLLTQTAFATNTYVITDGDRVFTYTTSATDPRKILGEAGLQLDENDTYTTQAGFGTAEITVRRSQSIHIRYYGQQITAVSHGETVEQLLQRLNLTLDEHDTLSHALTDETFEGMELTIDSVIHQNQTYTCTVPHDTTYFYDPSLPEGMEEVITPGVDGELLCTALVTYRNSQEISRNILTQSVSRNAVTEIIAVGTGLAATPASDAHMPIITDTQIILPNGEVLTYTGSTTARATAYYNQGTTATGTVAQEGVIAVDPSFIPFGTRMFIITNDGEYVYGIAAAEDAGDGNIVGNRIDMWFPTREECIQFGYRECTIYFLGVK